MAFIADHVIKRKHTANLKRDIPGLIGEIVEPLTEQREAQHRTIERYRHTTLTDQAADHAILGMYREGIINVTRIADVVNEWEVPSFDEFRGERTAWRLFNAATFTLTGRVAENPAITARLYKVINGVCATLN